MSDITDADRTLARMLEDWARQHGVQFRNCEFSIKDGKLVYMRKDVGMSRKELGIDK